MVSCPHCQFSIAGQDLPREIEPGMICPVCLTDMSLPPRVRVTGAQVFAKYVGSILSGLTFGSIVMAVILSPFDTSLWPNAFHFFFWILPPFVLMFAIGSALGPALEKTTYHAKRWLILSIPLLAPILVLASLLIFNLA